jgi:hypothetical protein
MTLLLAHRGVFASGGDLPDQDIGPFRLDK